MKREFFKPLTIRGSGPWMLRIFMARFREIWGSKPNGRIHLEKIPIGPPLPLDFPFFDSSSSSAIPVLFVDLRKALKP